MSTDRRQVQATIDGLESQRALLGDTLVDAALAPLRTRLAELDKAAGDDRPTQSLKHVTILFLDIVGSTALGQHLDPEETHAVMDGALARCSKVVEAHRGKVLNYAGDSVLAVFGADTAREDDAERAVRCGLTLLELGAILGDEITRLHGHAGFNVRVGVHSGEVLLGGGVDAESSIRGIAVNIAARMEQTAPAGALRISHDTYRLTHGTVDVLPQDRILVKGVDEAIATYLVRQAKPRDFRAGGRGIEGIETRMIGRDVELKCLQDAFSRLLIDRNLAMVSVIGEAGVGKSRLLNEFRQWIADRPDAVQVFVGRAYPLTQNQPFGLLRDILAWRLQIADGDSMRVARQKFEEGIAPLFEADEGADMAQAHAHLLGHLVGLDFDASPHVSGIKDDPGQIRGRAFHAAAQMFRRIVVRDATPILLLLEDLHWADDGSLDFLDYVAKVNRDLPMLIVGLARPALLERRADWGSAGAFDQRIDLTALDRDASQHLAAELLRQLTDVPQTLRELILDRAEGNPYFMEELVKMLVDQGAIEKAANHWTLRPELLQPAQVPQTLTGVLQARLDSLPDQERRALQEASVIGLVFWDRALAALDVRAPEALPALVRRDLTLPRQHATLDDMREYVFCHQILHHVTYNTLLKRRRRELHGRVAAWLAGLSGSRASDFLGAAAEHFELSGDDMHACEFFTRAAEHAKARFAHASALGHADHALAMLDREAADTERGLALRWRLLVVREFMLNLAGNRIEQQVALDAMQQLADALDDDKLRTMAARRRSLFGLRTADYRGQESAARDAIAFATRAGDDESRLSAMRLLADALAALGDLAAGEALARDGLAEARARGLRRVEGTFLNALSFIAGLRDDQVAGLALDQLDLPIWRELGDRLGETTALGNVGADWLWFGEFKQARHYLEEALKVARAIGSRQLECGPLCNLSQLARWQGDAAQALVHAREAVEVAVSVQAADFEAGALYRLGAAEMALGRHKAAAEAYARAETVAREIGLGMQHEARAGRAHVALALADLPGALAFVDALLPLATRDDGPQGLDMKFVQFTCHQVLARAGDPRASELLASAFADLQNRAATISDPALRESFLDNVPLHREIMQAWAASQAANAGGH